MALDSVARILALASGNGGGSESDNLWRPTVNSTGNISWTKSTSTIPPTSQNIKGEKGDKGDSGGIIVVYDNSEANPFIIGEAKIGLYSFMNSSTNSYTASVYIKGSSDKTTSVARPMDSTSYIHVFKEAVKSGTTSDIAVIYRYSSNDLTRVSYSPSNAAGVVFGSTQINVDRDSIQTISGVKLFSKLPESDLAPTTDNQFVNKKYVDTHTGGIEEAPKDGGLYLRKNANWTVLPTGDSDFMFAWDGKSSIDNPKNLELFQKIYDIYVSGGVVAICTRTAISPTTLYEYGAILTVRTITSSQITFDSMLGVYNWTNGDYREYPYIRTQVDKNAQGVITLVRAAQSMAYQIPWRTMSAYSASNLGGALPGNNTVVYVPTANYHPATKKYVDDTISNVPIPVTKISAEEDNIVELKGDGLYVPKPEFELPPKDNKFYAMKNGEWVDITSMITVTPDSGADDAALLEAFNKLLEARLDGEDLTEILKEIDELLSSGATLEDSEDIEALNQILDDRLNGQEV